MASSSDPSGSKQPASNNSAWINTDQATSGSTWDQSATEQPVTDSNMAADRGESSYMLPESSLKRPITKSAADLEAEGVHKPGNYNPRTELFDDQLANRVVQFVKRALFLDPVTMKVLHEINFGQLSFDSDDHMQIIRLWLQSTNRDASGQRNTLRSSLLINHKTLADCPTIVEISKEDALAISDKLKFYDEQLAYIITFSFNQAYLCSEHLFVSCPAFAQAFADTVRKEGSLKVLMVSRPAIVEIFSGVVERFKQENEQDPTQRWHDPKQSRYVLQKGQWLAPDYRPQSYKYQARYVYRDFEDWVTVTGLSMIMEDEVVKKKNEAFMIRPQVIYIVEMPGSKAVGGIAQEWLIVCPVSNPDETRIRPGDVLKIKVRGELQPWKEAWTARVTEPMSHMPISAYTAIMSRPWDKATASWTDDLELEAISMESLKNESQKNEDNFVTNVLRQPGLEVMVAVVESDRVFKQQIDAIETINLADEKKFCGRLQRVHRALLPATRLDLLPTYDIFESIRDQFPQPELLMKLNENQLKAVRQAYSAIAALLLIHGPPGTGKTYFAKEIMTPFFCHSESRPVLMLSPTNIGVDDVAEKLEAHLEQLQNQGLAPAWKYVVRSHSKGTTKAIWMQEAKLARGIPDNARPKAGILSGDEAELVEEFDFAFMMVDLRKREFQTKFDLINDPRVKQIEGSLGHRMLQMANILPGGPKCTDQGKFSMFRDALLNYRDAQSYDEFDDEAMKLFMQQANALKDYTLSQAAAVVTTTSNAGTKPIQWSCQVNTRLVIMDEAARNSEASVLPVFATPYNKIDGIIMMADPYQLGELIVSGCSTNAFTSQLDVSFFARMVGAGFPYVGFNEQHRAIPPVSTIYNKVVYRSALKDHPSTQLENRPRANDVADFNYSMYGKRVSIVYLDVPKDSVSETRVANAGSRYNEYYVMKAFILIAELLKVFPDCTIAYCTPYTAQARLGQSAKDSMIFEGVPNVHNVDVVTWDAAQGLEWDLGVLDLPVAPNGPGFCKSMNRLAVGFSRWKLGFYFISCKEIIDDFGGPGSVPTPWLDKFHSELRPYRHEVTEVGEYPDCRYYHPGQIDVRSKDALFGLDRQPQAADTWDSQAADSGDLGAAGSWNSQAAGSWDSQAAGSWDSPAAGSWDSPAAGSWDSQAAGSWDSQGAGETQDQYTEAPATEALATETPATETPATETPATEALATETPATETPATETPATEALATETPATEALATAILGNSTSLKGEEAHEILQWVYEHRSECDGTHYREVVAKSAILREHYMEIANEWVCGPNVYINRAKALHEVVKIDEYDSSRIEQQDKQMAKARFNVALANFYGSFHDRPLVPQDVDTPAKKSALLEKFGMVRDMAMDFNAGIFESAQLNIEKINQHDQA